MSTTSNDYPQGTPPDSGSSAGSAPANKTAWRPPEVRAGRGFWLILAVALIGVGGLAFLQFLRTPRVGAGRSMGTVAANLPELSSMPDMSLTDQNGRKVNLLQDLGGRVWIADFVFTSCAAQCPVITQRMVEFQRALVDAGLKDAVCVSISVDPHRDTPEKLADYAASWKPVNPAGWLLLTGDRADIYKLVTRHFLLALQDETEDSPILHSYKFALVDRRGRMRATYDVMTYAEQEARAIDVLGKPMPTDVKAKMLNDVRLLLAESPK